MYKLVNTNKMLKRKFYAVEINLQEEKRTAKQKRDYDDNHKDETEKKKDHWKVVMKFWKSFYTFSKQKGLDNLLREGKFGDTEVQQNYSVESPALRSRFCLKALEYLKEKGVFKGAPWTQVDCLPKSLRDQKEKNKDLKAKSSAKQKTFKGVPENYI